MSNLTKAESQAIIEQVLVMGDLARLNPEQRNQYYKHNDPQFSDCERSDADSHLRGMMMGQTLSLQVRNASVLLGTWQSIILAEFDGPRSRSVAVQVSGV